MVMFGLGQWEILAILIVAVILFGNRLPEVGRSVGKSIMEFKKGMKGIEDELARADSSSSAPRLPSRSEPLETPTAPKFEPPADTHS
jgi:sec-independent protein translocase protein TatA